MMIRGARPTWGRAPIRLRTGLRLAHTSYVTESQKQRTQSLGRNSIKVTVTLVLVFGAEGATTEGVKTRLLCHIARPGSVSC